MTDKPRLRGAALMGLVAGLAWWLGPAEPQPDRGEGARRGAAARDKARRPTAPPLRAAQAPEAPATLLGGAFWADQVMVRLGPDDDVNALAADLGLQLRRPPGRSGLAALGLPPGMDAAQALQRLRADPRVRSASPMGRIVGASRSAAPFSFQWHHRKLGAAAEAHSMRSPHHRDVVVAVLDTGVAYATLVHDGQQHEAAPSLSGSPIVAPYDFINDDPYPLDDHQHGTHIASLIASDGEVMGGAPGASLMPIKVLDANNEGDELSLIEGLWHAYDNGADIVNLSLSFPTGYRPSAALLEVLEALYEADQLMIAAAGNEGGSARTWPAASPLVVSVAAAGSADPLSVSAARTPYSNFDGGLTLLCPGGQLDRDLLGPRDLPDGYPDGLLAETIAHGEPGALGLWFMAGSSQAAAVASGMAAAMLADGAHPSELRQRLADGNSAELDRRPHLMAGDEQGPWPSVPVQRKKKKGAPVATPWSYVAMNPVLIASGAFARPRVWVVARDEALAPRAGRVVRVQFWSEGETEYASCLTNGQGACQATALGLRRRADSPALWQVQVHGLVGAGGAVEPARSALTLNAVMDAAIGQIDAARPGEAYVLGSHWPAGTLTGVGALAAGYAIVNSGSGVSTSPFGVIATPAWVHQQLGGPPQRLENSAGDAASEVLYATMGGAGVATSPFGFVPLQPPVVNGSGIATSPFGFVPLGGPADPSLPEAAGGALRASLEESSVGPHVEAGGFLNREGLGGADVAATVELEAQPGAGAGPRAASIEAVQLR